jgi:hypothetical protein
VLPQLPKDTSFTVLVRTHEMLKGPNDKTSHRAAAAMVGADTIGSFVPSVLTTEGALVPPLEPGILDPLGCRGCRDGPDGFTTA